MRLWIISPMVLFGLCLGAGFGALEAKGQTALADDIIIAAQGKENAEQDRDSKLGETPGGRGVRFTRRPGSNDIRLGIEGGQRLSPLPRLARRPAGGTSLGSGAAGLESGEGLAPAIERLRIPGPYPIGGLIGPSAAPGAELDEELGPDEGLTLDQMMARLVRANIDLRIKSLELPQAEADILTASLLANPLIFYSSDSVPYGSYSHGRPGDIEHGVSVIYPVDYSGKRRARIALARREKSILEAQYQNAVRLAIDNLYTLYVDLLAARHDVRSSEASLQLIDELLSLLQAQGAIDEDGQQKLDDLIIEREVATMSFGDEREQYEKAKQRLGLLLGMSPEEAEAMQVRGSIRVLSPLPPPAETLLGLAMTNRPDLVAQQRGIARARAELDFERAERFSDAYLLYTPYGFHDNSQTGEKSATTWGAGLFVSAPLFNRNQGNLRRAEVNIEQSHLEAAEIQSQVVSEVRQAIVDFQNTYEDIQRLEQVTLPAIRRKRDRGWEKFRKGEIGPADVLTLQRDSTFLVRYYHDTLIRHRRNTLRINTAVGHRILP